MRLECLKLAATRAAKVDEMLALAKVFEAYVSGTEETHNDSSCLSPIELELGPAQSGKSDAAQGVKGSGKKK